MLHQNQHTRVGNRGLSRDAWSLLGLHQQRNALLPKSGMWRTEHLFSPSMRVLAMGIKRAVLLEM